MASDPSAFEDAFAQEYPLEKSPEDSGRGANPGDVVKRITGHSSYPWSDGRHDLVLRRPRLAGPMVTVEYLAHYNPAWGGLRYAHGDDSGFDLLAAVPNEIVLWPGQRLAVPNGVRMRLPEGYELQVRPRSGLALKYGITIVNAPGTVDNGYTGELKTILLNTDEHSQFTIKPGERIAQAVLAPVVQASFVTGVVSEVVPSGSRGDSGFGSSGMAPLVGGNVDESLITMNTAMRRAQKVF